MLASVTVKVPTFINWALSDIFSFKLAYGVGPSIKNSCHSSYSALILHKKFVLNLNLRNMFQTGDRYLITTFKKSNFDWGIKYIFHIFRNWKWKYQFGNLKLWSNNSIFLSNPCEKTVRLIVLNYRLFQPSVSKMTGSTKWEWLGYNFHSCEWHVAFARSSVCGITYTLYVESSKVGRNKPL
jgi:hypothetical protein